MTPESLLEAAVRAVELGNLVAPARAIVDRLRTSRSTADRRLLHAGLRRLLTGIPTVLASEAEALRALVSGLDEGPPFDRERDALLARIAALPVMPVPPSPGVALVLAVSTEWFLERPIGVCQPLHVVAQYAGGDSRLLNVATDETVYQGFQHGVNAARALALDHGPRESFRLAHLVHVCTFAGNVDGLPRQLRVEGPSMGLAAAVAAISELIGVPVDAGTAFTGRLDSKRRVGPVGGVEAKMHAAFDKGIRRVFLPASNAAEVPADIGSAIEVHAVHTLDEAVEKILGLDAVRTGLGRLLARVGPAPAARAARWLAPGGEAAATRRILLTFVGKADPQGRYLGRDRAPIGSREDAEEREGPTLAVVRMVRPHAVYLLHTTRPAGNDFTEQAEATQRFLEAEDPERRVVLVPLPEITDPSDYDLVVPAVTAAVEHIQGHEPADARWFVNISSGTPAMESTWHILTSWQRLQATLLQAREARHLRTADDPRVREIVLPPPP
jgi:hypothetical protein